MCSICQIILQMVCRISLSLKVCFYLLCMYECFALIYMYAHCMHTVSRVVRRGHQIPWSCWELDWVPWKSSQCYSIEPSHKSQFKDVSFVLDDCSKLNKSGVVRIDRVQPYFQRKARRENLSWN